MERHPLSRRGFLIAGLGAAAMRVVARAAAGGPVRGFEPGEALGFLGGTNVVEMQREPVLETFLTLAHARAPYRCRYLAWEGDTVFEQPRDLNFGAWPAQIQRAGVTGLILQFGSSEALMESVDAEAFARAYGALLDVLQPCVRRIVLVTPPPFEPSEPPLPDLTRRNPALRALAGATIRLAGERRLDCLDLFAAETGRGAARSRRTSNGRHLNRLGHAAVARTWFQLWEGGPAARAMRVGADGSLRPASLERLRQSIVEKNRLWFNYWRPMNWAFLSGDRIEQASSRDHRDPNVRWFPAEMEQYRPLIAEAERRIAAEAGRVAIELGLEKGRA